MNPDVILVKSRLFSNNNLLFSFIIVPLNKPIEKNYVITHSVNFDRIMTYSEVYRLLWRCIDADHNSVKNSIIDEFIKNWFPFKYDKLPLDAKRWIS